MAHNEALIDRYLDALWAERGLARTTISQYRRDLIAFQDWLSAAPIRRATKADVLEYIATRVQEGAAPGTTASQLSTFRGFFRYLAREGLRDDDPTVDIDMPRTGKRLPQVLTEREVRSLLRAPATTKPYGIRDRAMLELAYASGLRSSELLNLRLSELNFTRRSVRVIGKGDKERLVPFGEEARYWLRTYIDGPRADIQSCGQRSEYLFPNRRGKPMTRAAFWHIVKRHAATASIKNVASPHSLRHAFATHMLNRGADISAIQLLLGHAAVSTTEIYTHVAKRRLKEFHSKHHPRG